MDLVNKMVHDAVVNVIKEKSEEYWAEFTLDDNRDKRGTYMVSNMGRVKICYKNGKETEKTILENEHGIKWIKFNSVNRNVSALIEKGFMGGNEEGKHLVYIDGDVTNCCLYNLKHMTSEEIMNHTFKVPGYRDIIWKVVVGYSKYLASNKNGLIMKREDGHLMTAHLDKGGYHCVNVVPDKDQKRNKIPGVHVLVGNAFLPFEEGKDFIDHKDKCRTNNDLTNLKRATRAENNENQDKSSTNSNARPVIRIDPKSKEVLEVYRSAKEAGEWLVSNNLSSSKSPSSIISDACLNDLIKVGFKWKYQEAEEIAEEEWIELPTKLTGKSGYFVSSHGRVKFPNGRITYGNVSSGYLHVDVGKLKGIGVHRLVAMMFLANPNNLPIVNHKNSKNPFNKFDNRVSNLEWVTHAENTQHAHENGETKLRKPVSVKNLENNSIVIYKSVKATAKALGVGETTVGRHNKSRKPINEIYEVTY